MNDIGLNYLKNNGEMQVAIARLMTENPSVSSEEWASHLFLCGAAMAKTAGCVKDDTSNAAQYAIELAYSTEEYAPRTIN